MIFLVFFSICGYVVGVGDRYLDNIFFDILMGELVYIDFGYVFGIVIYVFLIFEFVLFRVILVFFDVFFLLNVCMWLEMDMC